MELDGVELAGSLRGRQVPLLLAYLVLSRDRAVGREELIGALWREDAPRSEDAALRTLLSRLRSALGRQVLVGRDELMLELPEPAWVDIEAAAAEAQRAQRALEQGDARAAWALAQVPLNIASRGLLPGVQAGWLEVRRRELADIRLQALELIGRAGLSLGGTQIGSVQRAARALIDTEPYRESGWVLLMRALEAQGNIAEGLRVFEQLRTLLRDELGTVPSPEAMSAHDQLLHPGGQDFAPARSSRRPGRGGQAPATPGIELPVELQARDASGLVGRHDELSKLADWVSRAKREGQRAEPGQARVLLLSGEPGIGKSRLLGEAARRAHAGGAIVLAGHAPEATLVPYQPFLEALGHYVRAADVDELRWVAREHGAELGRLIPELRRRLPDLGPPEPGDPETDRYRLFEAVAGLLGQVAASATLLLVLDDLHWSDRPTLLLLRHLARSPQASGLAILGAYRSAGERWSEGFDAALAGLRRDRLMVNLEIGGLPRPDAMELVRRRAGGMPSLSFLHALYSETEGNPFFIEEIVQHLVDSGVRTHEAGAHELELVGLPDDVRDVIERRLTRLGERTIECLRVAAVIGRDFDSAVLERVVDLDEDGFLGALEDALEAGLVVETPREPGHYSFSHALIRETLYEGMSSNRRRRLHRRVGVALEEQAGDAGVDEQAGGARLSALAHHFTRAAAGQDAERAIGYALKAGEQATGMLAYEEAADHYGRALEVLERTHPEDRWRRCELLLELGEARVRGGERPVAWPVLREAAALAAELGESASLARAAIGASRRYIQPPGVVDEELIELLEQALTMTAGQRTVTRVRLLSRLCGALYYSERREQMRAASAEATALAAELRVPEATALACAARRRAFWGPGHLEQRLADSTQLLRAAREAGDVELTLQGHAWLVVDLLERGDRAAVQAQIEAFTAGARELRQPLFTWNVAVWRAMEALLEGRLELADKLAAEAVSSGIRTEGVTAPQYYAVQLLAIRREQARMAELEAPARELVARYPARSAWRAGLATLLLQDGREAEAREEFEALAQTGFETIPTDSDWMTAITLLADLATGLRDAERARQLYELLLPLRDSIVVVGLATVCLGASARYLGRLALTFEDRDLAIEHLRAGIEANRALRAPVELAHAHLDYAGALGDGPRARALVATAADTAAKLRLPAVAERAERTLDR